MKVFKMAPEQKLSLTTAILINLNIMMGAGIFINTVELSKRAGLLSGFLYPLIGILILPLIITIADLVKLYPSGGFYIFAKEQINPCMGFISTWSYFVAKLASATLMIHVSMSLILQIFPLLAQSASIFIFDFTILTIFILLNLLNMKTGSKIQIGFLIFKLIPLLFVIGAGFILFSPTLLPTLPLLWHGISGSLPFVLYAAMGFEAICALSNKIENPTRNGPRAILISFSIMILLVFLFQFFFYLFLANQLSQINSYLGAFPALLQTLFAHSSALSNKLQSIFHLAIAFSALGGCYGILYSNNWNLFILAQNKKIKGWNYLTKTNAHAIPLYCLLVEWLFCAGYLITTNGNQLILQPLAALGTVFTYFISVIAFLFFQKKQSSNYNAYIIPILALLSCGLLIGACIRTFIASGLLPLLGYFILLILGCFIYNTKD